MTAGQRSFVERPCGPLITHPLVWNESYEKKVSFKDGGTTEARGERFSC
jgi:hypothetical protein